MKLAQHYIDAVTYDVGNTKIISENKPGKINRLNKEQVKIFFSLIVHLLFILYAKPAKKIILK